MAHRSEASVIIIRKLEIRKMLPSMEESLEKLKITEKSF